MFLKALIKCVFKFKKQFFDFKNKKLLLKNKNQLSNKLIFFRRLVFFLNVLVRLSKQWPKNLRTI